ncbi:integrase [Lysinibacillus sphaericus]|uniref:site-specific integrase n=1 Tax=Lysinibacillus TaxID=400634 RepID=UPI00084B86B1|nr:site-specific integrase [Lysinibacillus sphaericus]OEC03481.1 integrase [Lysinibacillus sphaericus]
MTVYKDEARDTWYFITRIEQPDGSKKQVKRRGFKTEKAALLAEAKLEAEDIVEEVVTFEFVANKYMEWYKKRRKVSSYKKIESVVRVHLIPYFKRKQIKNIRARDVVDFQDTLIGEKSPAHIKKIHSILSAIFNYAKRQEYVRDNPATIAGNVDLEERKHINFWTLEEFKAFIKCVDDDLYYALFMTLYYSGMRKGELLALTWADLDFESNVINIDKNNYYGQITTTKTTSSTRKILMPKNVMNLLKAIKLEKSPKMSYVVFGEIKDSISVTALSVRFEKYVNLSGVKKIRIHDFRHSHASYLINKGTIVSVVAKRLGHSNVATTLNTYSHLYPSTEQEAVIQMENDFKPAQVIEFKQKEN